MRRAWRFYVAGVLAVLACIVALLTVGVVRYGPHIYNNWAVIEMDPVCEAFGIVGADRFRPLEAEPTKEFWRLARLWMDERGFFSGDHTSAFAAKGGKIFLTAREFLMWTWPFREYDRDFDNQQVPFEVSKHVAARIFEDRIASGDLTIGKMMRFKLDNGYDSLNGLPHPYACGFMGELILVGGMYASE